MEVKENGDVDAVRETRFEQQLWEIVLTIIGARDCEVFLLGSRAQKRTRRSNDFDIG